MWPKGKKRVVQEVVEGLVEELAKRVVNWVVGRLIKGWWKLLKGVLREV